MKDKNASPAGSGRMSQTQEIAERQCWRWEISSERWQIRPYRYVTDRWC